MRFTRNILAVAALAAALPGCAQLAAFGITPAAAPTALAIGAETRFGANCIRDANSGNVVGGLLNRFRIEQARLLFRATVGLSLSQNSLDVVDDSRELTNRVCPQLPPPVVFPGPAPETPAPTTAPAESQEAPSAAPQP